MTDSMKACVKSHMETGYRTTCYGKTFQVCNTTPYRYSVCDEYEDKK